MRRALTMFLLGLLACGSAAGGAQARVLIEEPQEYRVESSQATLSSTQAGAHPDLTTSFQLSEKNSEPYGLTRDIAVAVPQGMFGNPQAFPKCSMLQFASTPEESKCPIDTQVGSTTITLGGVNGGTFINEPIYNMPAPGGDVAARFAFYAGPFPVILNARLDPQTESLVAKVESAPAAAFLLASSTTFWGVPADPVHDPERITPVEAQNSSGPPAGRPSTLPDIPFMTNPTSCDGSRTVTTTATSYQLVSSPSSNTTELPQLTGCGALEFNPSTALSPTTGQASTGSGLDYELALPTKGLEFANLNYGAELRRAEVLLPEGVTINPSEAEGLGVCSEEELARETYDSPPNAGCPETSKVGTVEAKSPALDRTVEGSLYVAAPYSNPFGGLLAIYMVMKAPDRGVLVKLSGEVKLDPVTGRISAVFDNIPQLPVAHFKLHFREGARAPFVTPAACGHYESTANLQSWAEPGATTTRTSGFSIESGPDHGPCPTGGLPPFHPSLLAGPLNNTAGAYSPFYLRLTRTDSEQEITHFSIHMPQGVSARLAGVPFCPDAAIAAAKARTGPHGGEEELTSPSCPQASQIGISWAGAGVGDALTYAPGKLYLAGPYHGAPLSVVDVTAAKVGPFDLGTVVVREALQIDPRSAEVFIDSTGSDPIPHIIKGIPIHLRELRIYVDRPEFTLNPTSCEAASTSSTVTGSGLDFASEKDDIPLNISTRFQSADCAALKFKPSFKATTSGKATRRSGASLSVRLAYPKAPFGTQANIHTVKVELPRQLPSRLSTLQQACTDTVFERDPAACPTSSRVGYAKAITPILPVPLEGPAYFVSHGGSKWPELILVLQGYGITIDLHGETFIDKGITSSTFRTVPDQPVTSFQLTLPQGPDSALAAPEDLCHITKIVRVKRRVHGKTRTVKKRVPGTLTMPTTFTAQNGLVVHQNTKIAVTGCATARKRRRARS